MSLVSIICILLLIVKYVASSSHERRLYEDLLRDYSTNERPIYNYSKPITVSLKVALQQLIDVDEKNEMVNVNAWLNFAWNDYKLRWDPTEYGNITDLRFPVSMVWKPDVLLYNSVDTTFDSTFPSNVIVYNSGSVVWIPPGIFRISCKINIRFFPFDEQRCSFKFGSWTYSGRRLDLQPAEGGFDVSEYIENGEWTIQETKVTRNEKYYECCPNDPYLDVTFSLQLRRRTLYYGFNLIMPGILTTTVTLLGFSLPPDAGEKITLQITVLLSICFFLTMLSEMSPPTSEAVPLLGLFFSSCLIVVTLSTMFTVYVMNLHYSNPTTQRMGPWTRKLLLQWIPYLLRIKRPGVELKWKDLPPLFREEKGGNGCSQLIRNVMSIEKGLQGSCESGELLRPFMKRNQSKLSLENIENIVKNGLPSIQASLILSLQDILDEVTTVTDKILMDETDKAEARDWRFAALVVDKLCLHVFTFFIFGTVIGVMMMAPYLVA